MKRQLTIADIVFGAGGLLAFLFSFFDFEGAGSFSDSAWGTGFFPVATIPAVLGLAAVIVVALDVFTDMQLPAQVLTLNWKQVRLTWGISAGVLMLAFLIQDHRGADLKIGFWFMLIGGLGMAVGSVMAILGKGTETVNLGMPKHTATPPAEPPPPPPAV